MAGRFFLLTGIALVVAMQTPQALMAQMGGAQFPGVIGSMSVPVDSMKALRFRSVVPQQYDFSCGSAALATLLTYHYDRPTVETATFDGMFRRGDQELIRAQGFSLLDMKTYLESESGLAADGFRLGLDDLAGLGVPAIAMIETRGYRHFVVIKGLNDREVLVGDPALGLKSYPLREFEAIRVNDILLIIREDVERARASFNPPHTWAAITRAPVGDGVVRADLAGFTLNLPGPREW